jgi:hypothetical protein
MCATRTELAGDHISGFLEAILTATLDLCDPIKLTQLANEKLAAAAEEAPAITLYPMGIRLFAPEPVPQTECCEQLQRRCDKPLVVPVGI